MYVFCGRCWLILRLALLFEKSQTGLGRIWKFTVTTETPQCRHSSIKQSYGNGKKTADCNIRRWNAQPEGTLPVQAGAGICPDNLLSTAVYCSSSQSSFVLRALTLLWLHCGCVLPVYKMGATEHYNGKGYLPCSTPVPRAKGGL